MKNSKGMTGSPRSPLPLHNLNNLPSSELRSILKQIESQHDIMEAKNEQLATHNEDLRIVIKHTAKQRQQQLDYMLQKKKNLEDEIERCKAGLRVANSGDNTMYADMLNFKQLQDNQPM